MTIERRSDSPSEQDSLLRNVMLFRGLNDDEFRDLMSITEERRFSRGDVIYQQGELGDALFVIEKGWVVASVQSEDGDPKIIAKHGDGEYFGEMAILTEFPRSATMVVESEEAILLVLRKALFEIFIHKKSRAMREILKVMTRRVAALNERASMTPDREDPEPSHFSLLAEAIKNEGYQISNITDPKHGLTGYRLEKIDEQNAGAS